MKIEKNLRLQLGVFFWALVAFLAMGDVTASYAQNYIRNIYIDRRDIFDSTQVGRYFASKIINSLHVLTKEYIIEDELLFSEGDEIDMDLVDESERNLRNLGIFANVSIEFDSVGRDSYDVYVITQDRWSTYPSLLLGIGGTTSTLGGKFQEMNFLGTSTMFSAAGMYRTEDDIRWEGQFEFFKSRLFRTELSLSGYLQSNRFRTDQALSIYKPFRTLSTTFAYGGYASNSFGGDFLYHTEDSVRIMPFHERNFQLWASRGWMRKDRLFATIYTELSNVDRGDPAFRRAMDNSGKVLLAFSSVSQDFFKTSRVNTYYDEDLAVGGWGTAILGKIFPMGSGGESYYYVAGQGEQSYYDGRLYLFGQLSAGSAFSQSVGRYTYEEFYGSGYYHLARGLLLTGRIRQQTVWNWIALRQLVLDYEYGLRGYNANKFSGDNRIIANIELRMFPDVEFWILKFSGALFWDIGSVWNQDTKLTQAIFHNGAGFGLRIHDTRSRGKYSVYRIDLAYNFDSRRFGGIIFTTEQSFDPFGSHNYRLPGIYGMEFDYQ